MNEQQDKAKFRQAIDHALSGLEGDPFLAQRVAAHAEKGERKMNFRLTKGFAVALIVVLCMGTAAVAGGIYGGSVNWKGDAVYNEQPDEHAAPTAAPTDAAVDLNQRICDLSAELQVDGEALVIAHLDEVGKMETAVSTRLTQGVQDIEALRAIVVQAGLPWPNIPDGYEMAQGTVFYTCRAGGAWQLTDTQEQGDGLIAQWYGLDEKDAIVYGYDLLLRKDGAAEQYIDVDARMQEVSDPQEMFIDFQEGEAFEVLDIPGMDNAIAVIGDTCRLNMRRVLDAPVHVQALRLGEATEITCGEINVSVFSTVEDVTSLREMFAE